MLNKCYEPENVFYLFKSIETSLKVHFNNCYLPVVGSWMTAETAVQLQ